MMNLIKLLLTLPLIFTLIAPSLRLLGTKDLLSPRSITKRKTNAFDVKPIALSEVVKVSSQEEAAVLLQHALNDLEKNPGNKQAICHYMQLFMITQNRKGDSKDELIRHYLRYNSAVKKSNHPFDLEDLHPGVSPQDLWKYLKNGNNSERDADFLCAELIRRLKLGEFYSGHTWPKNPEDQLSKENIYFALTSITALSNRNNPYFFWKIYRNYEKTNIWKLHLLKEEGIAKFSAKKQQNLYSKIFQNHLDFSTHPGSSDLRWVNLSVFASNHPKWFHFQRADLRHANLSRIKGSFVAKNTSLANANLNGIQSIPWTEWQGRVSIEHGSKFKSTDFTKANLSLASFNKTEFLDCNFTEAIFNQTSFTNKSSFTNCDFRETDLSEMIFDDSVTFKDCRVTQSQYEKYFKKFNQDNFQIEAAAPSIEAGPSAILPLDVSL